jgi:hypothetical protein
MSDDMLLGVLRMPIDLAMSTDLARTQYWFRGQEAADRIEADARLIEELQKKIREMSGFLEFDTNDDE